MNPEPANLHRQDDSPELSGLNLLSEPFADTAAGRFFYAGADGAQRLDLLLHLAPYSPLLVVVGKQGVGKTTLLRQFVARAGASWRTAMVTARIDMGREELLRDMIRGFGLLLDHRADYPELYSTLVTQLNAMRKNAQIPVLLLDDAQYLSAAMMELLLKLCAENDGGHILSLILFGTSQLQNLLDSPTLSPLAARITHTFEVTSLGEEETGDYIRHRLQAAGAAADEGPFNAAAINKIYSASGGIPARINELAQQFMAEKSSSGKLRKPVEENGGGTKSVKRAIPILVALVAVVLMVAGPLRTSLFKSSPPAPGTPQTVELPPPMAAGQQERVIRPKPAETAPAATPSAKPEPSSPAGEELKVLPLPPLAATTPTAAPKPASSPAPAATPPAIPPPTAAVSKPDKVEPPKPPPAKAEPAKPLVAKPAAAKPKIASATSSASPSSGANSGFLGQAWVKAQPDDHFTLQLMALGEENTARQFIELHHLQDKAAYIPVRRDGKVLFALLYGSYPSRIEAMRSAKELPANWGAPNPWVRSFQGVHGELQK